MKQTLHLLFLLIALILQSCAFDRVEEPKYDIYRVEVGTYLNIRATPSKKGTVLGTINNGALVDVIEISDGWAKVSYRGEVIGYVSSDYLVLVRQAKKTESTEPIADGEGDEFGMDDDTPPITEADAARMKEGQPRKAEEAQQTVANSGGNVFFIGDSTLLASYEKDEIEAKLRSASEYTYIVNTVQAVPTGQLFDYAPGLLKGLSKELDSSMSWWQKFKSWFGGDSPSDHIVLLSWVKGSGLLQAECNGNSLKYLKMTKPEEYFRLQESVRQNATSSISDLGLAIDAAGKEYDSRSIFIKGQINTGNVVDIICGDVIIENILPRDSFWHKWVFGWIFAIPLSAANWIFVMTGSYLRSLFLLMLVILVVHYFVSAGTFRQNKGGMQGCVTILGILLNLFLWLSMLSLIIYMIPDMCNIAVMEQSGFSHSVISVAIKEGQTTAVTKNWFLIAAYWIGTIIYLGFNATFALNATLPAYTQQRLFEANKDKFFTQLQLAGNDTDNNKLQMSATPYSDLVYAGFAKDSIGEHMAPTIFLSFVLSGTLILYLCLFIWTVVFKRGVFFLTGVIAYKKQGFYN